MSFTTSKVAVLIWLPFFITAAIGQFLLVNANEHDSAGSVYYLYSIQIQLLVSLFALRQVNPRVSQGLWTTLFFGAMILVGYIGVLVVYLASGGRP